MTRAFVLASRPHGHVAVTDFSLREVSLPPLGPNQIMVQTLHVSIDPAIRGWLDDRPSYLPPVVIGAPVRALGLGRVVESTDPAFAVGSVVRGFVGWQERSVSDSRGWEIVPNANPARLGVLGMTGLTAWAGMLGIGQPRAGETVVVTGATGAVGSVAAQLAKIAGARVIGVAGGPEKCQMVTETLGLDGAVDYRSADWLTQLADATPDGIDVNFENVGGTVMEAIIERMNNHARMPLCGLVAGYNDVARPAGPRNFGLLLTKRVRLEGLIVLDHAHRASECESELSQRMSEGRLVALESIVNGFEILPEVFASSFQGTHVGKLIVSI